MSKKLLYMCMMAIMMVFSMSAYALDKKDGVYQIGTAADLEEFAALVNGGEVYVNAVLTADIVKDANGVMIGGVNGDYQGTFDGKGHAITIDLYSGSDNGTALFRNIGVHAVIQNLKVKGTITTDKKFAAGISVYGSGVVRGCYVDVNVVSAMAGDATHGGIVADAYRGTLIENCLAKFTINGATTQNCGGLIGWAEGPVNMVNNLVINDGSNFDLANGGSANVARNGGNVRVTDLAKYNEDPYANRPAGANYNNYVTNKWGDNNATTVVAYKDLADGRICYQLNNDQSRIAWVQTIGTDPFPVPAAFGSGQVYASGATGCDGKSEANLTFSNSGSDQAAKHAFDKYGMCPVCGNFNFHSFEFDDVAKFDPTDRAVLLKNTDDIFLAEGWNRVGDGFKLNMKMVNDIDVVSDPGQLIFNASNWVDGNFNGDGHTLTIEMTDVTDENASFIPKMTGIFENVIMHGSISSSNKFAASVTSHTYSDNVIIRNVFSDIEINATREGDNTSAGIVGVAESKTRLENVIYAGNVNGNEGGTSERLAGICGWASGQLYITNCAFIGSLNNAIGDSKNISRNVGNVTSTNVYCLEDFGFGDNDKFTLFEDGEEGVKSGKLAYFLNGMQGGVERFYQKIGEDDYPMPIKKDGALIYAVASDYRCDGQPLGETTYSNTPSSDPVLPDHQYVDGFCTVCDGIQEDFLTPVDGWYEISNGAELVWWTNYAAMHLGVNARLTDNIDMSGYCDRWANVGTEGAPFYGNFDGQFHTISNLVVDKPESNGVGLIAVMNSLPSKGFGGISDADARAAEGVYIKNVTLDESCSLVGHGYIGLVGMTAPWAGHVNIKGVMMCGDVTANGGPNASGVFGCVMNSTCHVTIDNCGMVGNVYGPKENGSFSGWLGSYAEVSNCFAVGSVEGIQDNDHYFARYSSATFTNCYARYGTQVPTVSEEDFESGALAWKANGSQFRTSYWYQNIGDDLYPFADPSHGTVIYAANKYMSATEETLSGVVISISEFYSNKADEVIAYQGSIDEMKDKIESLEDAKTLISLADALDTLYIYEAVVDASAKVYKKYKDKCEEIKTYLAEHDDFQGEDRDELQDYLENDYVEIIENHELPDSLIEKETTRVEEWLALAINNGYMPGTDVTKMLVNADFSDGKDKGWEGEAKATGHATVETEKGNLYGIESWSSKPFAISQTVKGMKPGYYLVSVDGAYRPQNDRYSYNYAANISANGVINFLQTVIEDPISAADAIDGENAHLKDPTPDLGISEDGATTTFTDDFPADGYVVHGPYGLAIEANAGRYKNYIACEVGADSVLTIGIANPHSKVGTNEWTGAANVRLVFLGGNEDEEATTGLATALESQLARANTILNKYVNSDVTMAASAPNYSNDLKLALEAAIAEADGAETPEQKMASIKKLSELFQNIYDGKQAYKKMAEETQAADFALQLIGDLITEQENKEIYNGILEVSSIYEEGTLSLEDALAFDITKKIPALAKIVAPQDENGVYQIGAPLQLIYFSAIVSNGGQSSDAVLTADINMTGIPFMPIGKTYDGSVRYNGVFDGQGHAIKNLVIGDPEAFDAPSSSGLFCDVENGTIKNLQIQSTIYTSNKFAAGITGYTRNAKVQDCDVDVTIHSAVEGDGTHGGIAGVNETEGTVVENCKVRIVLDGEKTDSWGGIFGWSTNKDEVKNCLIIAEVVAANLNGSNSVSRNSGNCSASNVFFTTNLNESNIGTKIEPGDQRFKTGELAWMLNGSSAENPHWFQTIGKEDMPHLFGGSIVWKYGNDFLNSRPNIQLNAFASNLHTATNASQVVVAYTLNAEAKSAAINFYAGNELKYSHVLKGSDLMAGGHEVGIENSLLGVAAGTELTYAIEVTGIGTLAPTKIGDGYKVNSPYGLAVNNTPSSKGFGQIYVAESRPLEKGEGSICEQKPGALFAFDATFQPVNSIDGTPGFYGGLDIKGNKNILNISGDYQFDLKNVRVSKDGRLFIARASGNSTSSVWEADPADLNKPWTPVFTGGELDAATGIVTVGGEEQNRPAVALAVEGEGENLKLTVLGAQRSDGEYNYSDYKCFTYNLGTATSWATAPSSVFEPLTGQYTIAPGHVGIVADERGGLWYEQYRANPSATEPSIKHFTADGGENFSDISTATYGEAIATTNDGSILAIPMGNGKVVIYETTYVPMANGKIFLEAKYNFNVAETQITGMAFDYANNLYITSSASKTLNRYAIPSFTDNKSVTPAREGFVVGSESGDPDAIENVNVNGNGNSGAIYNIAGQRVSKAQKGIYIVDGKKVANK